MAKSKPPWVKTNIPKEIKIKLWRVMRDNPTYTQLQCYVTNFPDIFTESEYKYLGIDRDAKDSNYGQLISRDTYKALQNEIKGMPLRDVVDLPKELHNWVRGLKGDTTIQQSIESLIQLQENHLEELANAARKLADNLKPYLIEMSGHLDDYVIGNEKEQDFKEQLLADSPTKWLLSHMKTELPQLRTLNSWLEIPTKYIDDQLLERLYLRASQKYFPGECEECEN